jgi:hypothetical protein
MCYYKSFKLILEYIFRGLKLEWNAIADNQRHPTMFIFIFVDLLRDLYVFLFLKSFREARGRGDIKWLLGGMGNWYN